MSITSTSAQVVGVVRLTPFTSSTERSSAKPLTLLAVCTIDVAHAVSRRDHLADVGDRARPDRHKTGRALALAGGPASVSSSACTGWPGAPSVTGARRHPRPARRDVGRQIGRPVQLRRQVGKDGDGALQTAHGDKLGDDPWQGGQGVVAKDDRLQAESLEGAAPSGAAASRRECIEVDRDRSVMRQSYLHGIEQGR